MAAICTHTSSLLPRSFKEGALQVNLIPPCSLLEGKRDICIKLYFSDVLLSKSVFHSFEYNAVPKTNIGF